MTDKTLTRRASKAAVPTTPARVPVTIRLQKSLVEQLDSIAAARGIDRSAVLLDIIERGFFARSIDELTAKALDKLDAVKRDDDAMMAMLEDLADQVAALKNVAKK